MGQANQGRELKPGKPLQRRTPLKRTPFRRRRGVLPMPAADPPPTRAQVKRRKEELARRRKLKRELLLECPRDGDVILCPRCLKRPDFRGLQLVHKVALSACGKTTRDNCVIRCAPCHFGHGEPWSHRTEGKPGKGDPSEKGPSQIFDQGGIPGDASGLT